MHPCIAPEIVSCTSTGQKLGPIRIENRSSSLAQQRGLATVNIDRVVCLTIPRRHPTSLRMVPGCAGATDPIVAPLVGTFTAGSCIAACSPRGCDNPDTREDDPTTDFWQRSDLDAVESEACPTFHHFRFARSVAALTRFASLGIGTIE